MLVARSFLTVSGQPGEFSSDLHRQVRRNSGDRNQDNQPGSRLLPRKPTRTSLEVAMRDHTGNSKRRCFRWQLPYLEFHLGTSGERLFVLVSSVYHPNGAYIKPTAGGHTCARSQVPAKHSSTAPQPQQHSPAQTSLPMHSSG